MRNIAIALSGAAAVAMLLPATANAQNPLSSIWNCQNPDNRQGTGAAIGGLLGGVLGNTIADDDETLGTILGAAVGAAAGSYIGCNMSRVDTNYAETATQRALNQNRSATWTNAQTGASGRIDIVNSFYSTNVAGRVPDYNNPGYNPGYGAGNLPATLDQVRFASGIQYPVNYEMLPATYSAETRTNIRAAPNSRATVVSQLYAGERFQTLGRTSDNWLLVSQNGLAVGYVAGWVVDFEGYTNSNTYAYNGNSTAYPYNNNYPYNSGAPNDGRYDNSYNQQAAERQLCRTFDQTVSYRNGSNTTTERFTACQTPDGRWVVQT
jgi:surface antigen